MSDRPIIFSAPMIRALLEGRKTQTRRVLEPQPVVGGDPAPGACLPQKPLRWAVGDRLWVREAWSASGTGVWTIANARARIAADQRIHYAADGGEGPWWPSIHMPREFSPLTLGVVDVRVQRLKEISASDVTAEGIPTAPRSAFDFATGEYSPGYELPNGGFSNLPGAHKTAYAQIWESLHGEGAWSADPWVAVITFRVIRANIDDAEAKA